MDYRAHYSRLIDRAKFRELSGYSERHHVVPRSLGGSNDVENIVRLTAEEHFVAHQLLVKIHPRNHNLIGALAMMSGKSSHLTQRSNKLYGWMRRRLADAQRLRRLGSKNPHSDQTKLKLSLASKGRPKSIAHRKALAAAKVGKKVVWSAEHRASHAKAMKDLIVDRSHAQSPTFRRLQSDNMKAVWAARKMGGGLGSVSEN